MISFEDMIYINQVIQGVYGLEDATSWFRQFEKKTQVNILRTLSMFALQAGAKESDVEHAIELSTLKATYTPCVLLQKGRLKIQCSKILQLPPSEYEKPFLLLIGLLSIADERRRQIICQHGCSHWWHEDLSKHDVVETIRKKLKEKTI